MDTNKEKTVIFEKPTSGRYVYEKSKRKFHAKMNKKNTDKKVIRGVDPLRARDPNLGYYYITRDPDVFQQWTRKLVKKGCPYFVEMKPVNVQERTFEYHVICLIATDKFAEEVRVLLNAKETFLYFPTH